jgi:hypothetical protein
VTVTAAGGTSAPVTAGSYTFEPRVTGVSPAEGPAAGGTSVIVTGAGFALGKSATTIAFGTTKAKTVNCTSSSECTVVSPAHAAGTVDVVVTVSKAASPKEPPDHYAYT